MAADAERLADADGPAQKLRVQLDRLRVLREAATSERAALARLLDATGVKGVALSTVPLLDHDVHDLDALGEIAGLLVGPPT